MRWKRTVLGLVFVGSVLEEMKRVSDILELPNDVRTIVLLCFGFTNETPPKRPKWPLNAVLHENIYGMGTKQEMKKYFGEANQKLLETEYFDNNVHIWAEHWQSKFQPKEVKECKKNCATICVNSVSCLSPALF